MVVPRTMSMLSVLMLDDYENEDDDEDALLDDEELLLLLPSCISTYSARLM